METAFSSGYPANSRDERLRFDQMLLQRIAQRDQSALEQLYDRYSRLLLGVIMHVVHAKPEAEDVLQEAFLQIWNRAGTFDSRLGPPFAWLIRVARNKAIDHVRSRRHREKMSESALESAATVATSDPGSNPMAFAHLREISSTLFDALSRLPIEQRKLIDLAYFGGYTQSELSEELAIPLGTVKTRMRQGMLALQQQLAALPELRQSIHHR